MFLVWSTASPRSPNARRSWTALAWLSGAFVASQCSGLAVAVIRSTGYPLSPTEPYLSVGSLQPTMLAYLVGPMATARCTVRVSAIHEEYRVGARWWG